MPTHKAWNACSPADASAVLMYSVVELFPADKLRDKPAKRDDALLLLLARLLPATVKTLKLKSL